MTDQVLGYASADTPVAFRAGALSRPIPWSAFVNPGLSLLALPGIYLLGRRLFAPGWALLAVAAVLANPTYVHHALSGDAHMGVAFCLIWGTYFLILWSQEGKLWQAFVAGAV